MEVVTERELGRKIRASIQADKKVSAETVGVEVEVLLTLDPPLVKEAWIRMRGW